MKPTEAQENTATTNEKSSVSRRSFLKIAGAAGTVAFAASQAPKFRAFSFIDAANQNGTSNGEWLPTTCQGCTSWCSKQAYIVDGRAIKVRGNPNSKVNGVASCPRVHMGLQQVYDPDRVKTPMKRTNPKKGRNEDLSGIEK